MGPLGIGTLRRRTGPALVVALITTTAGCGAGHHATAQQVTVSRSAGRLGTIAIAARVTPDTAGTPSAPRPVTLDVALTIRSHDAGDPPLVGAIDIDFPPGSRYGGAGLAACDPARLAGGGPTACPAASITGRGHASARVDTGSSPITLTLINGGARRAYLYVAMDNPARVRQAAPATVTPAAGGGYRLHLTLSTQLQIVAGVPVALQRLALHAGRGAWLTTTGCPHGRWDYRFTVHFADGTQSDATAGVPCH